VQKMHPDYIKHKKQGAAAARVAGQPDQSVWSMQDLGDHLEGQSTVPPGWVQGALTTRMKRIMVEVHRASRSSLQSGRMYDMFGFDFMVDDGLRLHLLEVNGTPNLQYMSCPLQERLMPAIVGGSHRIVMRAQPLADSPPIEAADPRARSAGPGDPAGEGEAAGATIDGAAADPTSGFELIVDQAAGFEFV
jgi:hypothetical protein